MNRHPNAIYNLDLYGTYYIKDVDNYIGPKTEIVVKLDENRQNFEHSFYTKEENLREFYKGAIIEIECEVCVLEKLEFKYSKMLLIVKVGLSKRYFVVDIDNRLIFIPLANREDNIINYGFTDLKCLDKIKQYAFHMSATAGGKLYVRTTTEDGPTLLQEIILGGKAPTGHKNDHCNSNGLDNRCDNLRCASNSLNGGNIKPREDGKYRGVVRNGERWVAYIEKDAVKYLLGYFDTPELAAKQYDIFGVHLYKGMKLHFNQINEKNSCSREEIEEILANPSKYNALLKSLNTKKERTLPKNITTKNDRYYYSKNLTKNFEKLSDCEWYLKALKNKFSDMTRLEKTEIERNEDVCSFKTTLYKGYDDLETAEKLGEDVETFISELDNTMLKNLVCDIDNYRKSNGDAFLKCYDGKNEDYYDIVMDDDDWKECCSFNFHDEGGYPVNSKLGKMHIYIFKKRKPEEYANKKPGETVDHVNSDEKWNIKMENLRLADKSLQSQNTKRIKKSLTKYTGVCLGNGNFYAVYKGKVSPRFKTMEEAARAYNEMALKDNPKSRINVIDTENTTVADLLGKDNLPFIIQEINTIKDIKEIIKINGLKKALNITNMNNVKAKDLKRLKEKIIELLNNNN